MIKLYDSGNKLYSLYQIIFSLIGKQCLEKKKVQLTLANSRVGKVHKMPEEAECMDSVPVDVAHCASTPAPHSIRDHHPKEKNDKIDYRTMHS